MKTIVAILIAMAVASPAFASDDKPVVKPPVIVVPPPKPKPKPKPSAAALATYSHNQIIGPGITCTNFGDPKTCKTASPSMAKWTALSIY